MLAMKIDAARNSDEDDIGVLVDPLGDHERRSSTRDIPDAAAAHGDHRRAATGTRVEDRRREGEAPAVTESLVNAGHAEPPFRNCYSSPIHKGIDARRGPRFDTLTDTLRSGLGRDPWTRLESQFANSLSKTTIWTHSDVAGRPRM